MSSKPLILKTGDSDFDFTHLMYNNEPLLKEFLKNQRKQALLDQINEARFQIELLDTDYISDKIDREYRLNLINSWHTNKPKKEGTPLSITEDKTNKDSIPIVDEITKVATVPKWLKQLDTLYTKLLTLVNLLESKAITINKNILQNNCKDYVDELIKIDEDIRESEYLWEGKDIYEEYSQRVDEVSDLLSAIEVFLEKE